VVRLRLIMQMKLGDSSGPEPVSTELLTGVITLHEAAQNRVAELLDQLEQARTFALARAADVDRLRSRRRLR
jgi:hypothetical protein